MTQIKSIYEYHPELIGREFYIHAGLGKAGTTFFREMILKKLKKDELFYLNQENDSKEVKLILADYNRYDHDSFLKVADIIASKLKGVKQKRIFVSGLDFYGSPWNNYEGRLKGIEFFSKLLPDATAILTLRNQVDMLASLFKHSARGEWAPSSIEEFLNIRDNQFQTKKPGNVHSVNALCFDYYGICASLDKHFPDGRLKILFLEDLQYDAGAYTNKILNILNCTIEDNVINKKQTNKGHSALSIFILLFMNRVSNSKFLTNRDNSGLPFKSAISKTLLFNLPFLFFRRCILFLKRPMSNFLRNKFDNYIFIDWDVLGKKHRVTLEKYYREKNSHLLKYFPNDRISSIYLYK